MASFTSSQQVPFLPTMMRAVESLDWDERESFLDEEFDAQMRSMDSREVLIKVLEKESSR